MQMCAIRSPVQTETNRAAKRAAEATAAASVGVRTRLLRWSRVNSATRPREEELKCTII